MPLSEPWASLPTHYPSALIDLRWLGGAQRLLLRPVLPQDDRLLSALVLAQSASARRNRFHGAVRPSPRLCQQLSQVDYRRHMALVVSTVADGVEQLVADARYGVTDDGQSAEFALMVDERWQRLGVGAWALGALQQAAAGAGLTWLQGVVLEDNQAMLQLARRCGFASNPDPQDARLVQVQQRLGSDAADRARRRNAPGGLLRRLARAIGARPTLLAHPVP